MLSGQPIALGAPLIGVISSVPGSPLPQAYFSAIQNWA
jgi:hypothetical protein